MRSLFLVLAAIFVISLPTLAGPLTGAPVIKFELGGETPTTQGVGGGIAIGYSNFTQKLVLPDVTVAGLGTLQGSSETSSTSGAILSGEIYKVFSEKGNALKFGGWFAAPEDLKFAEAHIGYKFNRNWGIELGQFLLDAPDFVGTTSYHITYDLPPKQGGNLSFQFGVGGMPTRSESLGLGLGEPDMETSTLISAFANANYGLRNDMSVNLGLWFLSQKATVPSFILGGFTIPEISSTSSVLQWTLSFGKSF